MAARPRQPIGSAPWIAEERASALQISQSEVEEFTFSARNDVDWLNEHMAEIFSENQMQVNNGSPRPYTMLTLMIAMWPRYSKPQGSCVGEHPRRRERRTPGMFEW